VFCGVLDAESATGSRNHPQGSISHASLDEDGEACNETQNNGMVTPTRPKKRQKALVHLHTICT